MQFVLRDLSDSSPLVVACRDVDAMYDEFFNHLVPGESRGIVAPNEWSYAYSYV